MTSLLSRLRALCRHEAGQALTEFGLMAPLLFLLLGGVVYCGAVVVTQEELAVAARHVARRSALEGASMNASGKYRAVSNAVRASALREAVGPRRGASLKGINWGALAREANGPGRLDGRGNVAVLKAQSKTMTYQGQKYRFGAGVVFHGVTVKQNMLDYAPIARLAGLPTIEVGSSSVMPTELPVRTSGEAEGILEMNRWISDIVNDKKVFKKR